MFGRLTKRIMREASAWIVIGLGMTAFFAFMPPETPTWARVLGMILSLGIIVFAASQLLQGRRERLAVEAVALEVGGWIHKAEAAFLDIVNVARKHAGEAPEGAPGEGSSGDSQQRVYAQFASTCGDFIEKTFGLEERRSFDGAPKKNIHGDRVGRMGYESGSMLVLQVWLERLRARVLSGQLATVSGLRASD